MKRHRELYPTVAFANRRSKALNGVFFKPFEWLPPEKESMEMYGGKLWERPQSFVCVYIYIYTCIYVLVCVCVRADFSLMQWNHCVCVRYELNSYAP